MVFGDWTTIIFCRSCLGQLSCAVRDNAVVFVLATEPAIGHKYIRPKAIHDAEVVEEYSHNYIYFACIAFINSVRVNKVVYILANVVTDKDRVS